MMNIYDYLKKDHRLVEKLMDEVLGNPSGNRREKLFNQIREELDLHSETEEKTFYNALKEKGGKAVQEKEEHAEEEHDEIRKFLAEVEAADVNSEDWLVAFGQLKHTVMHHVHEEEDEIFEKAKKILSEKQAEQLAEEMDMLKQKKKGGGEKKSSHGKGIFEKLPF